MSMISERQTTVVGKLTDLVTRLTQGRGRDVPAQAVDSLQAEIYELQKSLAQAPTRPTRAVRDSRPLEPITEQQKIVDLAG